MLLKVVVVLHPSSVESHFFSSSNGYKNKRVKVYLAHQASIAISLGQVMDSNNPPMVLPNGQVYSYEV